MTSSDAFQDLQWVLDKMAMAKKKGKGLSLPELPKPPKTVKTVSKSEPPKLPKLEQGKKDLKDKKQTELQLWKAWKDSDHDPKHLDPLLKSLDPFINSFSNKYKGRVEVPNAAIDFEHKRLAVKALKEFNPSKGVSLSTWVGTHLPKGGRFINKTQNIARIPENISRHIGTYKAVKANLSERLGHEPDDLTLHEEANKIDPRISMKVIKRLNKEIRKGLISSTHDGLDEANDVTKDDRFHEVVHLLWYELPPKERVVHEYMFGLNGKPVLGTGDIAKKMKWDASKVSKIKGEITNKMKPYLGA